MAKRFTDTLLWQKEWFLRYTPKQKLLFRFLLDNCDCAGIYEANYILLAVYIGESIEEEDILSLNEHKKQVEKLPNGKFFIPDFIKFQYGILSKTCKPHLPVIASLKQNGLESLIKGYLKGIDTLKEIEKESGIKKDLEDSIKKEFSQFWEIYPKQRAGNQEKAYEIYKNIILTRKTTPTLLLQAVRAYAQSAEVQDRKAKQCVRWLDDAGYLDDYGKPPPTKEEIQQFADELGQKYGKEAKERYLLGIRNEG